MCVYHFSQPFAKDTIGTAGVVIVLLLVSISTFGTANGTLLIGSREGELPDFLSGLHATAKTPIPGIIVQVWPEHYGESCGASCNIPKPNKWQGDTEVLNTLF